MRLGEALGLQISDFVMGRGDTPYAVIVPREDNPNGTRVTMMRPRRVYVGTDLERLFADYLTHLACRAAGLGMPISNRFAAAGEPSSDRRSSPADLRAANLRTRTQAEGTVLHSPSGNIRIPGPLAGQLHQLLPEFSRWLPENYRAEHQLQHQTVMVGRVPVQAPAASFHDG
ncbi:hypothetical protein GCM10010350_78340 [Streptomyces galilaeus]|nr:hypothetical protein GCM10010350_78340 [Streptomyces galilaeus]